MSQIISVPRVMEAYDLACRDWQITFGYPVIGRSVAGTQHGTGYQTLTGLARMGTWRRTGLKQILWDQLLKSLVIGGDPSIYVTYPESIFTWRGPFGGNLRDFLENYCKRMALPQDKKRLRGVFAGADYKNRMYLRIPHR